MEAANPGTARSADDVVACFRQPVMASVSPSSLDMVTRPKGNSFAGTGYWQHMPRSDLGVLEKSIS